MKAVIPAAGLGTRFLPATKAQPKEMLPIVDKPAIQYVVEEAVASGFENILIVTGRGKRAIEDHFDRSVELEGHLWSEDKMEEFRKIQDIARMAEILYVRQKEPLGLGHAVLCAKNYVGNEPFAVLLGDDIMVCENPCIKQLLDIFKREGKSVLAVEDVPPERMVHYGMVVGEPVGEDVFDITEIVEKPSLADVRSSLGTVGRYVLEPEIFTHIEKTRPDSRNEIQLTDAISSMLSEKQVLACKFQGKRYDIGSKLGWIKATIELSLEREDLGPKLNAYLKELAPRL
ncbi:MAG: UTP--glucose-1-phosphate uridylyltransferase GalU [Candidatus Thermoplasmatota archaeon]|nr:UTP--glucose-1-phosphate uridylyltransferase GalU [Candidatus Thermoplasmatota archaeon]